MDILELRSIKAVSSEVRDGIRVIQAQTDDDPRQCPFCNALDPYKHDSRVQEFADAPVRGAPVRIQIDRQRYRCRDCKKTFFQPLIGFSTKRDMTQRLVEYIAKDSLIRTFTDVSKDVGLDVQTVRDVFFDFSEWLRVYHPISVPRVMGVDEAARAQVVLTAFTDIERRSYFDLIPSRKSAPLNAYLKAMPGKEMVQVVTMDLHLGFVTAIGKHFPHAVRVADRFHVVRTAQVALSNFHASLRKSLPKGLRLDSFRSRGAISTKESRLDDTGRKKVEDAFTALPQLKQAHEAKERFLAIYDAKTRAAASKAMTEWVESLPPELETHFAPARNAIRDSRELILNYFDHPFTNAYAEAANGISKLIERVGRGYSFEVLRVKLLYGKRAQDVDSSGFDSNNPNNPKRVRTPKGKDLKAASKLSVPAYGLEPKGRLGARQADVERLIDEGYYDNGNDAIAKELGPLAHDFARKY